MKGKIETKINKIVWPEKGLEFIGDQDFCTDAYIKILQKIEKKPDVDNLKEFNTAQKNAMFNLDKEGKDILVYILNFHNAKVDYPTPMQILTNVCSNKKNVNYITRDKMKKLSKFLEFTGKFKGKKIRFTKEFLELK